MFKRMLSYFTLLLLLFLSNSSGNSASQTTEKSGEGQSATVQRLIDVVNQAEAPLAGIQYSAAIKPASP